MYQWCNLNRPYSDLFFDTFWCNHPLGGVVFAFFIKVNAHDSPRNVFTFESSFDQMWDLSFDKHLFNTFLGCWVFRLQKFTPGGKVTEWENTTTSEETEGMCLKIYEKIQNFIVIYLDKVELMSVPGSLGKWVRIVHDSIEHTICKKWCSFFPLSWSWYNWKEILFEVMAVIILPGCGWVCFQTSNRARTPSLHSMMLCSAISFAWNWVAEMAIPKPTSKTLPP